MPVDSIPDLYCLLYVITVNDRGVEQVTFAVDYGDDLAHPIHRRLMTKRGTTEQDGAKRGATEQETAGHDVGRMELLQWGPTAAVTALAWYDGPPAAVAELLETVETTVTQLVADDDGGTYAFTRQSEYRLGEPVIDLVERARVAFRPPVTFAATGTVRFDAVGESDDLGAFYEGLAALLDARIDRVRTFRRWPAPARLTDRQRAALAAAVDVGYYAVPRTGDLDDVAAELDCAHSTAGELVRKAEAALVTGFVDGERREE